MENPLCYATFNFPVVNQGGQNCPLDCVDMWKKEVAEHPACMKVLEVQMKDAGWKGVLNGDQPLESLLFHHLASWL